MKESGYKMSIEALNTIKNNALLLHDKSVVDAAIKTMAKKLTNNYQTLNPIFIVVMNGGLIFAGKLLAQLNFPAQIDYCHATRYRGEKQGKDIQWKALPQMSLTNRHVVLLDDILDEGTTLKAIKEKCLSLGAKSVKTAVLIEKEHQRKIDANTQADYCELTTPDHYIFGYGMDIDHYWRNTESIYIHQESK